MEFTGKCQSEFEWRVIWVRNWQIIHLWEKSPILDKSNPNYLKFPQIHKNPLFFHILSISYHHLNNNSPPFLLKFIIFNFSFKFPLHISQYPFYYSNFFSARIFPNCLATALLCFSSWITRTSTLSMLTFIVLRKVFTWSSVGCKPRLQHLFDFINLLILRYI